jgi:trigger factor
MKTSIKNLSETKIQLTITVDKAALDDAYKVAVAKLSKDVKVQGFRKGKVPANVAIKNIDPNLLQEETLNNYLYNLKTVKKEKVVKEKKVVAKKVAAPKKVAAKKVTASKKK